MIFRPLESWLPTGVTDPVVNADNDRGLIGQQWAACQRFWGAIRRRTGWNPGDVSFGAGYEPIPDARAAGQERSHASSHTGY